MEKNLIVEAIEQMERKILGVKEGTIIIGSGFSASGVSGSYEFTGSVSGTIKTQDDTEQSGTE